MRIATFVVPWWGGGMVWGKGSLVPGGVWSWGIWSRGGYGPEGYGPGGVVALPLPPWTDKYLWKHYLPATSFAGGKNEKVL